MFPSPESISSRYLNLISWILYGIVTFTAVAGRSPNPTINVPLDPPATAFQIIDAFPGLSFTNPTAFRSPSGDTQRLFVGELGGKIHVIPDVSAPTPTSSEVIDLAEVISTPPRSPNEALDDGPNEECGLLGFDFHPNYATNGYFYVLYSVVKADDPSVWYQRLSRFTVPTAEISASNPVAAPGSELILLEQRDRGANHNGGDVHFGPDGYLYASFGDEDNPSDHYGNSQRIDMNFFGCVIRIDVDKKPGSLEPNPHPNPKASELGFSEADAIPRDETSLGSGVFKARYGIPPDNPWVHTSDGGSWDGSLNGTVLESSSLTHVRSEFWAIGLRSPWRFSFDPGSGDLWLADVGQSLTYPRSTYAAEEINIVHKGGNYGWAYREGTGPGKREVPEGFTSIDPVFQIEHNPNADADYNARSFTGGVVYRGTRFGELAGAYVFGDWIYNNVWALRIVDGEPVIDRLGGVSRVSAFGIDPSNGDILAAEYYGGRIMRIVTNTPTSTFPETLGETGLFSDLTTLTPASGLIPYKVNLPFWSDHAQKSRWFTIPDGTSRMSWTRDGAWDFPVGQIWVKHFELNTVRGDENSSRKRLETRVLTRNSGGVYGVSYRWNEQGTEAYLVEDGGESFSVEVEVDNSPYSQRWSIPSRAQCVTCHNPSAGYALGFDTLQLNLNQPEPPISGNLIAYLENNGYFDNTSEHPTVLPRHVRPEESDFSIEARVRSYLAVNCSYCHAGASGNAPGSWDGRHFLTLEQSGLIGGQSTKPGPPHKLVTPGDTALSTILQSISGNADNNRMPPIGTSEIDAAAVQLLIDWIDNSLPSRRFYSDWRLATFGSSSSTISAREQDADGDGIDNYSEFLAGTLPLDASSFPKLEITVDQGVVDLTFSAPKNRSVQAETSENLIDWTKWIAPGNQGLVHPGGSWTLSGEQQQDSRFFRLEIKER